MASVQSIKIKRAYDKPSRSDGVRILVDRLWPRGLTKSSAKIDHWFKELAPSHDLRKWYQHTPERWEKFKKKYFSELKKNGEALNPLLTLMRKNKTVTFLYSSKEPRLNNAQALKLYLLEIQ